MNETNENATLDELLADGLGVPPNAEARVLANVKGALRQEGARAPAGLGWVSYAAAAALVLLAAGLFWGILGGKGTVAPPGQGRSVAGEDQKQESPSNDHGEVTPPLTDRRKLDATIATLDAEKFEHRSRAIEELSKQVENKPYLRKQLERLRAQKNPSPELLKNLETVLAALEDLEIQQLIDAELKDLDRAIAEAPKHYKAPDAATIEALKRCKTTLTFKDTPIKDIPGQLCKAWKLPIAFDPKWQDSGLRYSDTWKDYKGSEVLSILVFMTGAEHVVRGRVIVLTTPERAATLRWQPGEAHPPKPVVDGWQAEIQAERKVNLGQPIGFQYGLRNVSKEKRSLERASLDPKGLMLKDAAGKALPLKAGAANPNGAGSVDVAPNAEFPALAEFNLLSFFEIKEPGRYTLQYVHELKSGDKTLRVPSEVVSIEVLAPQQPAP